MKERGNIGLLRGQRIGANILREPLGAGRTSNVFSAYNEEYEQNIVVKALTNPHYPLQRFLEEVDTHRDAQDANLNVVPLWGHDVVHLPEERADVAFMELSQAHGGSLNAVLRREGPLGYNTALQVASEVAATLDGMHSDLNKVHGDVKPANLLFKEKTSEGLDIAANTVWVADLGMTGAPPTEGERRTSPIGSPRYAAREAVSGQAEPASDQFSTAATLAEMLSGDILFPAETPAHYRKTILSPNYEKIVEHRVGLVIPEPLRDPFVIALDRDPDKRYDSVSKFVEEVHDRAL